jgi:dTDP-4-dehydrorhamnose reductase
MKTLLITGAQGMLGSALQQELKDEFRIVAASRDTLDISSFEKVRNYLSELKPDIILHAAAYTNVEEAERRPEDCYRVNYHGTLNLLNAAGGFPHKFIYISSTGCYGDHKQEPYSEYDEVRPTTVYHRSKYEGEKLVIGLSRDFLVLRTGWLFGGSTEHKKNFVFNRYKEAAQKAELTSDPFQSGNPTNTEDVARQIGLLIEENIRGTYNVVCGGSCTRYEYVKFIVETFGLPCKVNPADKPFPRLAKVSPNEAANNDNLIAMGLNRMPHWQESLAKYINGIREHV